MGQIKGRYLFEGDLKLTSPLIIGSGESDYVDIMLIRDSDGRPYIPATSLVGVLRHKFYDDVILSVEEEEQAEYFWGSRRKTSNKLDSFQSALYLSDLNLMSEANIQIRDGIEIDNETNIVIEKQNFDYEVIEPGAIFRLKFEVLIRERFSSSIFLKIIKYIVKSLSQGDVRLGAMTTKGFGCCRLVDYNVYYQDYCKKKDVFSWLSREKEDDQKIDLELGNNFNIKKNNFYLEAKFTIKNSLIIRTYPRKSGGPDAVHISSGGRFVLPGTSVRGAIRARALRIVNTLGGNEQLIRELFGYVSKDEKSGRIYNRQDLNAPLDAQKSRLIVEETNIENVVEERQYRVRIDRFTGGACKNALFDSKPLWPISGEDEMVDIKLTIEDYKDWEVGLILLVLKDLWTGDLPIGGEKSVGRGVLIGTSANIEVSNNKYSIKRCDNRLNVNGKKDDLEYFVQSFIQKCMEGGNKSSG